MLYTYRCPLHGVFEANYPLAKNPTQAPCPGQLHSMSMEVVDGVATTTVHEVVCPARTERFFVPVNLDGSAIPSRSPVTAHTGKRPGKHAIDPSVLAQVGSQVSNR